MRSLKIMNRNHQSEKDEPERIKAEKPVNVSVNGASTNQLFKVSTGKMGSGSVACQPSHKAKVLSLEGLEDRGAESGGDGGG